MSIFLLCKIDIFSCENSICALHSICTSCEDFFRADGIRPYTKTLKIFIFSTHNSKLITHNSNTRPLRNYRYFCFAKSIYFLAKIRYVRCTRYALRAWFFTVINDYKFKNVGANLCVRPNVGTFGNPQAYRQLL